MPVFLFGCLFSLIWSSAFVAGKFSLFYAAPLNFLSFRFLSAGILLLVLWRLWQGKLNLPALANPRLWRAGGILGLLNYALYLGFSYIGLQTVSPQLVILMVATTPFVTSVWSLCLGGRIRYGQWLAMAIAFTGVYLALADKLADAAFGLGALWVISGVAALAGGTLYYQHHAAPLHPLPLIGIQNLVGGLLLLPFIEPSVLAAAMAHTPFVLSWLYQVLMVSIAAMWMWFWLVRRIGANAASVFHLMNPIFGILLTAAFFHTGITRHELLGTALVIGGMALAFGRNRAQTQKPNTDEVSL